MSREGYYPDTADFNTVGVRESKNFRGTFRLDPLPISEQVPGETEVITKNEVIRLNNIYYEFNDDKILDESKPDLDFIYDLMTKYPDIKIELSSHTDSRGNNPYNQDLSQRRANSAKGYLVEKGIGDDRIDAVGYGEELILNRCADGVKCSEVEHRLNRRTEFKVTDGPDRIEFQRSTGPLSRDPDGGASLDSYPIIDLERESIDLGSIPKGEVKSSKFKFTNTGKADLMISTVSACECTEVEWPRYPIAPGESDEIIFHYNSEEKEGKQEVTVDIFANTETPVTQAFFNIFVEKIN